jgi:glycosyltransferase involved in cell wall biosynthesis
MKVREPKVSVIIPVYNGSNYLKQAIDSALAQTYSNIEVIVVNDGSNDNGATEQIAESYGSKIRYYYKKNGGVATALNLGMKKMKGEYFSWLSHDDMYYQDKVEKQINFLAKQNFKKVFLYSNYSILRDQLITPVVHNHEMLIRKPKYSLLRGCVNGITVLIPKTILDEMGYFNEELRCTQDYDYWRKIEAKYDFVHMEEVLSITRLHSAQDSVMSPRVIAESDELWIDMIKNLSKEEKLKYEGTLYNFYFEMAKFLESTPYAGTLRYTKSKLAELDKEVSEARFNPKVSVVIPFYNRIEKTLTAVKSVLGQSYQNIEIVLVDDGSTDDLSKLKKFVKSNSKIKFVALMVNSGPAAARNLGIMHSDGEYIAFLDSDDTFVPDKIERQLASMVKHNPDVSYTSYLKREGDQETVKYDPGLTGIVVPRIISNCTIATPTAIVRKKLLVDHRISFYENMRVGEDTRFWLEIAKFSEILLINEPLTIVNVDKNTHAQDSSKLVIGIKNLITYLLNDDYYSSYSYDISVLCNYFYEINSKIRDEERYRLLNEGPVVSVQPFVAEVAQPKKNRMTARIKNSIPYRVSRKLYHSGVSAPAKAAISKFGGK